MAGRRRNSSDPEEGGEVRSSDPEEGGEVTSGRRADVDAGFLRRLRGFWGKLFR